MTTSPITRLNAALEGRYRIESELGEGGMATVYLAADLKHERKVALKVLKPELAAVVGAERFLTEIKTTANLQHPHILPLFDSGEADSFLFYVMPYVEGENLRQRLQRERELPVTEAVQIAREVGEALSYAHRRGIIHRDIKPENVLLQEGRSQVADFGIALALSSAGGTRLTETGLSIGTPSYMSPEQATGDRELDSRSDIYSLGCLLYEMLAGQPPHTGTSAQAILASVLTNEPKALRQLRPKVPTAVDAAVREALARIPADRPISAEAFTELLTRPDGELRDARRPARYFGTVALAAAAAGLAFFLGVRSGPTETVLSAPGTPRQVTFSGYGQYVSLSPDGNRVVYSDYRCADAERCRYELLLQDLEAGGNPVVIEPFPAEYGSGREWYWSTGWSPAGDQLILTRSLASEGLTGIYLLPPLGGAPRMLRAEVATGAAFRPDGHTVDWLAWPDGFDGGTGVWRTLDLDTDSITSRTLPIDATFVSWSPGGESAAFAGQPWDGAKIEQMLALARPDGTVTDTLTAPPGRADWPRIRWLDDAVVFMSDDDVYRLPVNVETGEFMGVPELVFRTPRTGWVASSDFDVTSDGRRFVWFGDEQRDELITFREGEEYRIHTGTALATAPAVSPDGSRVAYLREDAGGTNLYIQPFSGGEEVGLTSTRSEKQHTEWSPDGDHIAFVERDGGVQWLSTVTVGGGRPRRLAPAAISESGQRFSWMPSSEALVYALPTGEVGMVDLSGAIEIVAEPPDNAGVVWDLVPSAVGDSIAMMTHLFTGDDMTFRVHTIPVTGGSWSMRNVVQTDEMEIGLRPTTRRFPGWISPSAASWREDGQIDIALGRNTGITHVLNLWSFGRDTAARRVMDLTDPCGAPTMISMNPAGTHMACMRRESLNDMWVLDGFVLRAGG